jgi:hypothetical protein
MVDLALLQSISYIAGALGVCIAATFYVVNLRETTRNRNAAFANSVQQNMQNKEWQQRFIEVLNMQWRDFDDFRARYDSSVDVENYAKRHSILISYDILGWQLRRGLIGLDFFSDVWALGIVTCWHKFKPIIEGYRGWQYPKGAFRDFEYLAGILEKKLVGEDPEFMKKMSTLLEYGLTNQ